VNWRLLLGNTGVRFCSQTPTEATKHKTNASRDVSGTCTYFVDPPINDQAELAEVIGYISYKLIVNS